MKGTFTWELFNLNSKTKSDIITKCLVFVYCASLITKVFIWKWEYFWSKKRCFLRYLMLKRIYWRKIFRFLKGFCSGDYLLIIRGVDLNIKLGRFSEILKKLLFLFYCFFVFLIFHFALSTKTIYFESFWMSFSI